MLPATITFPVDVLNNGTPVNKVYSRDYDDFSKSVYTGPAHTLLSRQLLQFQRTPNKVVGNSFGTFRTATKVTVDKMVAARDGTNVSQPMILEVSTSIPVGVSDADKMEYRQLVIAILDHAIFGDVLNGTV